MRALGRHLVVKMRAGKDARPVAFLAPEEVQNLLGGNFVGQDRRWVVLVDRRARWMPEPGEAVVARVAAVPRPGLIFVEPLAPVEEWGARLLREWGFPNPEELPGCGRVELEHLARTWAQDPERAADMAVRLWGDSAPESPMVQAWIGARATEMGLGGLDGLRVEDVLYAEKLMAMGAARERARGAVEERIRDRKNPTPDPWEVARDRMIFTIRSRGICFRAARALMHRARVGIPTPLGDPDEAEGIPELEGAWDAVARAASVPRQVPEVWEAAKEWALQEQRRLARLLKGIGPSSRCLMRLERPVATVATATGLETSREFRASFRCTRGCRHEVKLVAEAKVWWEETGGEYEFGTPRVARDEEPGPIHVVVAGIAYVAIYVDGDLVERREI